MGCNTHRILIVSGSRLSSLWQLFFSPRRTIARLAASPHPAHWLPPIAVLIVAARAGFLTTAIGQQALVDQWVQRAESVGVAVDDRLFGRIQTLSENHGVLYGVALGVALGVLLPLIAAVVIKMLCAGKASWAAALTLSGYASVPLVLRELIAVPLGLVRETLASPLTVGTLFPMLDEASPLARFLWSIDLFACWWLVLAALGVSALSGRKATSIATVLVTVYALGALVLSAAISLAGRVL